MHITAVFELINRLCPALERFRNILEKKSLDFYSIPIHGRLPNAVPKNSIEQFSGFIDILSTNIQRLRQY
jgi:fumarate hydratase class II